MFLPGRPGSQLAALAEAISAGAHDAVFAFHPMMIGSDLDQIGAFDLLCRQHRLLIRYRWSGHRSDPKGLFDVIKHVKRFTVTDEHLRLLRRAYISWDDGEFGAPGINGKRPYGNSNVFADMADILDMPDREWADEGEDPPPEVEWRFLRLHVETAIVLQIGVATGEFLAGRYVRGDEWNSRWERDEA